ncbi:xanthine dehydrogenase family protein molybdopterin-binding subunit [Acidimicrobiales bacterium]|nr:xanthine dehydrogenase family protein molybdopterin-binding subunit [bacterium]MDC3299964.1 xanthine dehydrogenase family protein molybdopterin-binding subunit [Acidimicrobiales bacterium]
MSVGSSPVRFDALSKTHGTAIYPGDRQLDDALVAKIVFTGQPHARLVSLDISAAEAVPGVVTVITAADVPRNEYGLTKFDQPVFISPSDDDSVAVATNVSRWEADHLAMVVAESLDAANAGAVAILAEWEQLALVPDIDAALDDTVLVHPQDGTNRYTHLKIRHGDTDQGFADADVVVEHTYEVPYQEHAYLQPEAASAWIDESGRLTVEVAGQWTHEDQEQIAHALRLELAQVRVIYPSIGGAFGGREDMSVQVVMAVAVQKLATLGVHRPVQTQWSREESIVGHHKRHRGRIHAKLGATSDGKITAVHAQVLLDAGAYNYTSNKVLGNAHLCVTGPYEIPNATVDSFAIYTTSPPGGAFRGFGGPQGAFVAEMQMNRMADVLGIDPVELRRRNQISDGSIGVTGAVYPAGVSLPQVIESCAERSGFDQPLDQGEPFSPFASLPANPAAVRRGRGFAAGVKNVGFSFGFPERCEAEIHLHGESDDTEPIKADLFHAGAEVGQGAHQAFLQMAAEATGVALDHFEGHFSDTTNTGDSGSASASRLTFMAGNSIVAAAEVAAKAWAEGDRPAVGFARYEPPETDMLDAETGQGQPNFSYGYMAQAVELTVDAETGHIRIDRVTSTHDVGRTINPELLRGQVEGAVVQAHGYVLSENLQVANGMILNPRFSSYLIPGIGDVPTEVDTDVLELSDPLGPFGARGVAEMPYITYAPAVVAALHDATGVWFNEFPLTPSRVLAGLDAAADAADRLGGR